MKQFHKFLVSLSIFIFSAVMFPELYTACLNYSGSVDAAFVAVLPFLFISIIAIFPIYFGLEDYL